MIYVDSCIPMYIVWADHPNKRRVIELAAQLLSSGEHLVSSVEAFQEILRHYRALRDLTYLHAAYEALETMLVTTADVTKADVDLARAFATQYADLSARDCLHTAVMKRLRCPKIWTFDHGFDQIPSLQRVC